jgi:hypothetical protein
MNASQPASEVRPTAPDYQLRSPRDEAELLMLWQAGVEVFGDAEISWRSFRSLFARYPAGITIMTLDDLPVGVFEAWPVKNKPFQELVSGLRSENRLTGQSLYDASLPFVCATWYLSDIFIKPEYRKTRLVQILVRQSLERLANSEHMPAGRFTLAALAYSREGELLCRRFGLQQLRPGSELPDRMPLYLATYDSPTAFKSLLARRAPER